MLILIQPETGNFFRQFTYVYRMNVAQYVKLLSYGERFLRVVAYYLHRISRNRTNDALLGKLINRACIRECCYCDIFFVHAG